MPETVFVEPVVPVVRAVSPRRLLYVDWLRGLAVVIMISWHTLDAWTRPEDRSGLAFHWIIILGGCAAPLFLFLAGVSVSLAGATPKRGWQILGLAHLFRLQSFLLNPWASWSSLLKPDILNILGLGMAVAAYCRARATTRMREIVWLLLPAAVIVWMAPGSRVWQWPALLRPFAPRLEAYIRPMAGMGVFSVFPWIAFVFTGAYVGLVLKRSGTRAATLFGLAIGGGALIAAGAAGAYLPDLTGSEFWTTSLAFFLIRTGGMILAMPLIWLWLQRPTSARWSPAVVFGRESLFVYWVHVELAYGFFTYPLQRNLALPWALVAFALFTAAMLGLTVLWMRRPRPLVPAYLRAA